MLFNTKINAFMRHPIYAKIYAIVNHPLAWLFVGLLFLADGIALEQDRRWICLKVVIGAAYLTSFAYRTFHKKV